MGGATLLPDHMAHLLRRGAGSGLRLARQTQTVALRQMSTALSQEEKLSMEKLYPLYRDSWFGSPGEGGTWEESRKRWVIVEAYPLFAAIGFGCSVCFIHCMRHLFFSPDVFVSKSSRSNAMIENFKEGENWKGNTFRSMGAMKKNKEDPFR